MGNCAYAFHNNYTLRIGLCHSFPTRFYLNVKMTKEALISRTSSLNFCRKAPSWISAQVFGPTLARSWLGLRGFTAQDYHPSKLFGEAYAGEDCISRTSLKLFEVTFPRYSANTETTLDLMKTSWANHHFIGFHDASIEFANEGSSPLFVYAYSIKYPAALLW